ncbi:MAG: alpha/beta hydrolase [Deltaproteobacteria bacterium]|nr:alpha/beta hydrolase [Deltaproteobacteria bacterium]
MSRFRTRMPGPAFAPARPAHPAAEAPRQFRSLAATELYCPRCRQATPVREPVVLLGESFSGLVAVRLAARQPVGLAGLVLVASFLRYPPARAFLFSTLARDLLFRVTPPAALLRMLLLGMDAPDALVEAARAAIRRVDAEVLARRLRAVLAADVRANLAGTRMPVLYLGGFHDRLVGRWAAEQVKVVRPDSEVLVLDAPHLVLQRRAEEAAAALTAFAGRCAAPAAGRREA